MRFLVLGGAGYVGSHFVWRALAQGHQCRVYDNLERGHRWAVPNTADLIEANILDENRLTQNIKEFKPDVILHYAAYALVPESVQFPLKYFQNNVSGVVSLLTAMERAACTAPVVFSSSCAVFGTPEKLPISEDDTKNPQSPYGLSKLMAEQVLADAVKQLGNRALALRYFNACGADESGEIGEDHEPETHLVPNVIKAALRNQPVTIFGKAYPTPDGTCVRDYIHVTDLADAHLAAAEYLLKRDPRPSFDAIHLGTGKGYSNLQVVRSAEKVLNTNITVNFAPPRPGDPAELYADVAKARSLLGFTARYSSLETIIKTAATFHRKSL